MAYYEGQDKTPQVELQDFDEHGIFIKKIKTFDAQYEDDTGEEEDDSECHHASCFNEEELYESCEELMELRLEDAAESN